MMSLAWRLVQGGRNKKDDIGNTCTTYGGGGGERNEYKILDG
jgi:hypothetical protein